MKDLIDFLEYEATKEQIAYGQQKNREHIWNQAVNESIELIGRWNDSFIDQRYEYLCKQANITPW
jgi:hypothetical protein